MHTVCTRCGCDMRISSCSNFADESEQSNIQCNFFVQFMNDEIFTSRILQYKCSEIISKQNDTNPMKHTHKTQPRWIIMTIEKLERWLQCVTHCKLCSLKFEIKSRLVIRSVFRYLKIAREARQNYKTDHLNPVLAWE